MATKAFKENKINEIKEKLQKAQVAIVTEYRGLSVDEIMKLRRSLQQEDGDYMVTKNTLAKIAVKGTAFEVLNDVFKGPIALAFGFKDQVSPAKALAKFIKEVKKGEKSISQIKRDIQNERYKVYAEKCKELRAIAKEASEQIIREGLSEDEIQVITDFENSLKNITGKGK